MNITAKDIADLIRSTDDAEAIVQELVVRFDLGWKQTRTETAPDIMEVHEALSDLSRRALLNEQQHITDFLGQFRDTLPTAALRTGGVDSEDCASRMLCLLRSGTWNAGIGKANSGRELLGVNFDNAFDALDWALTKAVIGDRIHLFHPKNPVHLTAAIS